MILTEEQAKKKACHEARCAVAEGPTSFNRLIRENGNEVTALCITSECMAWRWQAMPSRYQSYKPRDGWEHVSAEDAKEYDSKSEFWLEPEAEWQARRKGFCGKAGWPHHA